MRLRTMRRALTRTALLAATACSVAGLFVPVLSANAAPTMPGAAVPRLDWQDCAGGFDCASASVPRDYRRPDGATFRLAVIRHRALDPAHRIGTLFVNPGGPGGSGVEFVRTAPPPVFALFSRFDVVGWDPRGVGGSSGVDCTTDSEDDAAIRAPLIRPQTVNPRDLRQAGRRFVAACLHRNPNVLPYLSTANTAHDLDLLRAAVGDDRLTYIGISYGTMIGATYAALFPGKVRAIVSDSPIDADVWTNRPMQAFREQTVSFEQSLHRLFVACAASQPECGFGGRHPDAAFDSLVARMNATPTPAPAAGHPEPMTGDQLLQLAAFVLYNRRSWAPFAQALAAAEAGDASELRDQFDLFTGRHPDGTWDPHGAFFATVAQDWRLPRDLRDYLAEGRDAYANYPHFWWNTLSYYDGDFPPPAPGTAFAAYPLPQPDAYRGPFRNRSEAPMLVIAGTHDPATPYLWARRYVKQLGNARLLTYDADGHGQLRDFNTCLLTAAAGYLTDGTLPAVGAHCTQDGAPFPG